MRYRGLIAAGQPRQHPHGCVGTRRGARVLQRPPAASTAPGNSGYMDTPDPRYVYPAEGCRRARQRVRAGRPRSGTGLPPPGGAAGAAGVLPGESTPTRPAQGATCSSSGSSTASAATPPTWSTPCRTCRRTRPKPPRCTVSTLSAMPPTASTWPSRVISPLIARPRTGRPVNADTGAATIVTPAEAPSLVASPRVDAQMHVGVAMPWRVKAVPGGGSSKSSSAAAGRATARPTPPRSSTVPPLAEHVGLLLPAARTSRWPRGCEGRAPRQAHRGTEAMMNDIRWSEHPLYADVVKRVPPELHPTVARAVDLRAADAWLHEGTKPAGLDSDGKSLGGQRGPAVPARGRPPLHAALGDRRARRAVRQGRGRHAPRQVARRHAGVQCRAGRTRTGHLVAAGAAWSRSTCWSTA